MKRVLGCYDALPKVAPEPGQKLTTPPAIRPLPELQRLRSNRRRITGARITVFPVTIEAAVIPAMIAKGKFHGG
jgi:hypothetical protein